MRVFVTRTGRRYHADYHCPSFEDAAYEHGRDIDRWPAPLRSAGRERTPCEVCWRQQQDWDQWSPLEHRVEIEGDSEYEGQFVRSVLREIPRLSPSDVTIQQRVEGRSGRSYRVDFLITSPETDERIVVEVDGHDKAPGRKDPEEVRRDVEQRRHDLVAADWPVLNFTNRQVSTAPAQCVSELRRAIARTIRPRHVPAGAQPASRGNMRVTHVSGPSTGASQGSQLTKWLVGLGVAGVAVLGLMAYSSLQESTADGPVTPSGQSCPSEAPIKGNVNDEGERIFHEPGWRYYDATWPEQCFATSEAAEEADFRASNVQ